MSNFSYVEEDASPSPPSTLWRRAVDEEKRGGLGGLDKEGSGDDDRDLAGTLDGSDRQSQTETAVTAVSSMVQALLIFMVQWSLDC